MNEIDPQVYLLECLLTTDGPATGDTIPLAPTPDQEYEAALQVILDAFQVIVDAYA